MRPFCGSWDSITLSSLIFSKADNNASPMLADSKSSPNGLWEQNPHEKDLHSVSHLHSSNYPLHWRCPHLPAYRTYPSQELHLPSHANVDRREEQESNVGSGQARLSERDYHYRS